MKTVDLFVPYEHLILTKHGIWLSNGVEVTHEGTLRAFHKFLVCESGKWFIRIGRESKEVEVEDTGWFVVRMEGSPSAGVVVELSSGERERLDPGTLEYVPERLVCRVGGGARVAKFLSGPYRELLGYAEEDEGGGYFLRFGDRVIGI